MEFRTAVKMTLFSKQQKRHYKEQTFGLCGEKAMVA